MPIHQVIREKRKALGYTQEQLADRLGVTAPAVNKWEKGSTYPDVSLLPPLARLLRVDLNTLLCFNEGLTQQEIAGLMDELMQTIQKDGLCRGFELALEAVREYPASGALIHAAAIMLDGALIMSGLSDGEKAPLTAQITALYERAAECGDEEIRLHASFMLASKYLNRGAYEEAQAMLNRLPDATAPDKRQLQARLFLAQGQYDKAAVLLERKLLTDLNELLGLLWSLGEIRQKAGATEDAARIAEISRQAAEVFQLWDYIAYVGPLEDALAREDPADCLSLLDSLLCALEKPWRQWESPLFRHISEQQQPASGSRLAELILPPMLAELERSPKYAFLQSSTAFRQLLQKYRNSCRS